ncbi:MAG: M23 family metallopeptidase [Spirochaetales bacterium]|nr:M23 family metallopeptidase [Spirochaetales bacterium]
MRKFYFLIILFYLLQNPIFSKEYLSDDSDTLDVYFEKLEEGGYAFYGDNRHFVPQFVSLGFISIINLSMDRENPSRVVLHPGDEHVLLCTLIPVDLKKSYSFRSRLIQVIGDPLNTIPSDFLYLFPFAHGEKHKIDQGFGGKFSHQDENYYAVDFSMDIGTPIYAARDGVVVEVKEDSNRGGASSSYAKYGNFISIYHSDGTFASYVHLKKDGAEVEVGDEVFMGDLIGYSGNTGLSTGPHLHFSVNIPTLDGSRQSIPIKMMGINGEAVDPAVGEYYYSAHPGLEYFEVVFGKDLSPDLYNDYSAIVEESGKLEFRDEQLDDTTILFCRNGKNEGVTGSIRFQFQNCGIDKNSPIDIDIPPLTEIFVGLIKPIDSSKPFAVSYTISYRVME